MKNRSLFVRKAAVLLASLDSRMADELLDQLTTDEAHAVREAMATLGEIEPLEQDAVIEEFFRIGPLVPDKSPPGIELDKPVAETWTPPQDTAARPFRVLEEASNDALARYLEREHPQTIAVVVSHLPSQRAAAVLAELPAELQGQVTMRLVHLEDTNPELVREIERGMQSWILEQSQALKRRVAGMETLKGILSAADDRAKESILRNLSQHDPRLAGKLATPSKSIEFAELQTFDDASLANVLRRAPAEIVRLALVGIENDFLGRVLNLLPASEARLLRKQLDNLGPTRLSDVEQAQQELAKLAAQLESAGSRGRNDLKHLSIAV